MWRAVMWRGSVPKALERWMRRAVPPAERWTIWRRVASVRVVEGRVFWGSGICWAEVQVAIQVDCAGRCRVRERRARARRRWVMGWDVAGGSIEVGSV
jgi:hypothetical protein